MQPDLSLKIIIKIIWNNTREKECIISIPKSNEDQDERNIYGIVKRTWLSPQWPSGNS